MARAAASDPLRSGDEAPPGGQIRCRGDRHGRGKARHHGDDGAGEAERRQGLVDRAARPAAARGDDVTAGGVALGRHLAVQERVAVPDHAHEAVPEQRLHPHLRSGVARPRRRRGRSAPPAAAARPCRAWARSAGARRAPLAVTAATSRAANVSTKPSLARMVKVRSRAARSSPAAGRARPGPPAPGPDALAQLDGLRRRHQPPAGADQQRVAGRGAQARQRAAHRPRRSGPAAARRRPRCPRPAGRRAPPAGSGPPRASRASLARRTRRPAQR